MGALSKTLLLTLATSVTASVSAVPALSQVVTNGLSVLGTFNAPTLPQFLAGANENGTPYPWGTRTVLNCNPYDESQIPNTGVTRYYQWEVTNTTLAPDGVQVPTLLVNGQFPGPLIEANWGDWIEVTVKNSLKEGTAMHWHGFLQTGTPYYDGVPGVTQCPIAPGKTFTYRFRAELYGTTWWHSHLSAQYMNGLAGPIVIHGPCLPSSAHDIDLGPIMLTDWFHSYYETQVADVFVSSIFGPVLPPHNNNMLINGKGSYNCSNTDLPCTPNAGVAKFRFQSGKKHLLRLINHSAEATIFFSIDGYELTVIANDFVPVVPYQTDLVTLSVGQRTDIVVKAKGNSKSSVWMRATEGPPGQNPSGGVAPEGTAGCSLNDGLSYTVLGAIYYEKADTSILPNTTSSINPDRYLFPTACNNQPLADTVPAYAMPAKKPDATVTLNVIGGLNETNDFVWWINNSSMVVDWNDPQLLEAKLGNLSFPTEANVYNYGNISTLRVIVNATNFPASHPMHLHGHNFQVLAEGIGAWDGTITRPNNPQRRDTHLLQPLGYGVFQWDVSSNPGVWSFHCHIAWHISEGMGVNFIEQEAALKKMSIPSSVAQTCRDWSAFSGSHVVNQIDSGL